MVFNSLYLIVRKTTVKAEPNVRIRIRGAIIRIQITETRIRTIIRISRQEGTPEHHNQLFQRISINTFFVAPCIEFCSPFNYGTSGTQCPHSHTRSDKPYSDNRTPQPHHHPHEQTGGHHTSQRLLIQDARNNHSHPCWCFHL